jgi:hypothetical protein
VVQVPHTGGLRPIGVDDSWAGSTTADLTTATLPAGGVLVMQGPVP